MQETMESMVGARFLSSMDLKSGFWQVRMSEKSRQYTAFTVGSLDMYEFLQMPYGLCNAPATFQRLMQNCLGELNLTYALVYLDDVIVYSKTEGDHLRQLQAMFERFYEHGLKLKPSKCRFLRKQITFLRHKVSADDMKPGNLNLKGIAEMAPPACESLQYGLDLTCLKAIIDNLEPMTSCIGRKVRTGVPRQVAGHRIPTDCEEKLDLDSLGSFAGDVPVS